MKIRELSLILITLPLLALLFLPNLQQSFAETHQLLSHSLNPSTYVKNMTIPSKYVQEIGTPIMLAGNKVGLEFISNFVVDTNTIPHSDFLHKITIESMQIRMVPVVAENSSTKYFVTISVCVDDFPTLDHDYLLAGSSLGPFSTYGIYSTPFCSKMSPQDSVIIEGKKLPKPYLWDVTNLSSFLVEKENTIGLKFIINAKPVELNLTEYFSNIRNPTSGLVGIIQPSTSQDYGGNDEPELIVSYSDDPSDLMNYYNSIINALPAFLGVSAPIIGFFLTQHRKKLQNINKSVNSILNEIDETDQALSNIEGEYEVEEFQAIDDPNFHVRYTHVTLDSDAYDSVVYSGLFTELKLQTQNPIRELYGRVKDHNQLVKLIGDLLDKMALQYHGDIDPVLQNSIIGHYQKQLTRIEKELISLIPKVKDALRKEVRKKIIL